MSKSKRNIFICLLVVAFLSVLGVTLAFAVGEKNDSANLGIPPEIIVEYGDYSPNDIPNAVKNVPYKLFSARAKDVYGKEVFVFTRVYAFYNSDTRYLIQISDGCATCENFGKYTVEYSAVDRFGNKTVTVYDFDCNEKDSLSATVLTPSGSCLAGEKVKVSDISVNNYCGKTSYTVKAMEKNGKAEYVCENGYFAPEYAGEYSIVYTVKDYNETATAEYAFNVSANSTPKFSETPSFNKYYLKDCPYALPKAYAVSYLNGSPENIGYTVKLDGVALSGTDKISFLSEGNHLIEYVADNGEKTETLSYNIVCVDVGFTEYGDEIRAEDYFYPNGVTTSATANGVVVETESNGASTEFITAIPARLLTVDFTLGVKNGSEISKNGFSVLNIYLTDTVCDKKIKFTLTKNGEDASVLSDSTGKKIKTSANFTDGERIVFSYDDNIKGCTVNSSDCLTVTETESGENFDGFGSSDVLVSFEFNEVSNSSAIKVLSIDNQVLSNSRGDGVSPNVILEQYVGGEKVIGDKVVIPRAFVCDILSPLLKVNYSVTAPDGKPVVSSDGVILDKNNAKFDKTYGFEINQVGNYIVSIQAIDYFENQTMSFSYAIVVVDSQKPKIKISTETQNAKPGETVKVREVEVSGNDDNEVLIYSLSPEGVLTAVKDGEFKIESIGVYKVYYFTYDKAGNMSYVYYEIKSEK